MVLLDGSPLALEALVAILNADVHPRVPSRGSVGASGDLVQLARLALVLVGEGEAWGDQKGVVPPFHAAGHPEKGVRPPFCPGAERLARAADTAAALSIAAMRL